jgi:hypothetical protein
MIIVAAVGAFVGSLLTVSVGATVFAHDRVRRRRRDRGRPYAL